jgi:hypothetical protein
LGADQNTVDGRLELFDDRLAPPEGHVAPNDEQRPVWERLLDMPTGRPA